MHYPDRHAEDIDITHKIMRSVQRVNNPNVFAIQAGFTALFSQNAMLGKMVFDFLKAKDEEVPDVRGKRNCQHDSEPGLHVAPPILGNIAQVDEKIVGRCLLGCTFRPL